MVSHRDEILACYRSTYWLPLWLPVRCLSFLLCTGFCYLLLISYPRIEPFRILSLQLVLFVITGLLHLDPTTGDCSLDVVSQDGKLVLLFRVESPRFKIHWKVITTLTCSLMLVSGKWGSYVSVQSQYGCESFSKKMWEQKLTPSHYISSLTHIPRRAS